MNEWMNERRNDSFSNTKTRGQSNLTKSASRGGAHSPVRGDPRGSKFVPLNSWGMGSYQCSIVTIGLGCTVWPQCTRVKTNQRPTTNEALKKLNHTHITFNCVMLFNYCFLSASLYVSKRGAYWDRLCRDVVGRWLVGWSLVGCHARACTVAKRCILGL